MRPATIIGRHFLGVVGKQRLNKGSHPVFVKRIGDFIEWLFNGFTTK